MQVAHVGVKACTVAFLTSFNIKLHRVP
jgi:hypothetical protein